MNNRNLNRVFVYNKVLKAWRKEEGLELTGVAISILLALDNTGGLRFAALRSYLRSFGKTYAPNLVSDYLKELVGCGFVKVVGSPSVYSATMAGELLLARLETRCRLTRVDR